MQKHFFTIFIGPMMSGKTSKLLLRLEKCKFQNRKIIVFKPNEGTNKLITHNGLEFDAIKIESASEIFMHLSELDETPEIVAVDEAFKIQGIAEVLIWLYRNGLNIAVATLDISNELKSFKEIEKILPWATHIEKCRAACTVCGEDANYTYKKVDIEQDLYEPRCFEHMPKLKLE